MRQLLFILLLTTYTCAYGQGSGLILDARTKAPLDLVHVISNNYATTSNSDGSFYLSSLDDSILFSRIAYATLTISSNNNPDTIYLQPQTEYLDTTTVNDISAYRIMELFWENRALNHYITDVVIDGFYSQYHKEDGKYVRLIEAVISMYDGGPNFFGSRERVQVKQLRRSHNYEMNGEEHSDHLLDLLAEDPIRYESGSGINPKALSSFHYTYDSLVTVDGELCYALSFKPKASTDSRLLYGQLLIHSDNYALVSISLQEEENPNNRAYTYPVGDYHWEFINGLTTAIFTKKDDRYELVELKKTYVHQLTPASPFVSDHLVEEHFELYVDQCIHPKPEQLDLSVYRRSAGLYSARYKYDAKFWEQLPHPSLPADLEKDLTEYKTLSVQFRSNGRD